VLDAILLANWQQAACISAVWRAMMPAAVDSNLRQTETVHSIVPRNALSFRAAADSLGTIQGLIDLVHSCI
jgi:hypothetical protein